MLLLLRWTFAVLVVGILIACGEAAAQEAEATGDVPAPTIESVEAVLKDLEEDADLDEALKGSLEERYEDALTKLRAAEQSRKQAAEYRLLMESAASQIQSLGSERETVEEAGESESVTEAEKELAADELASLLEDERAALSLLKTKLRDLETAIVAERGRPEAMVQEVAAAQESEREAKGELTQLAGVEETDPLKKAEAVRLRATVAAAQAASEKLEQERVSSGLRVDLLAAQRDLTQAKVKRLEARVEALREQAGKQLDRRIEDARRTVAEAVEDAAEYPGLKELAAGLGGHVDELQDVAGKIARTRNAIDLLQRGLGQLQEEHQIMVEELKYGDTSSLLSGGVLSQRKSAALLREIERKRDPGKEESNQIRLAALRNDTEFRRLKVPTAEEVQGDPEAEMRRRLLREKRELLTALGDAYRQLIRERGTLEIDVQRFLALFHDHQELMEEKLFWVATVPPVNAATVTDLPSGVRWMFGGERFGELLAALGRVVRDSPFLVPFLVVLSALSLIFRRRLRRWVGEYAAKVRRVSSDRYGYTVEALLIVLAQTVPVAVLLWVVGGKLVELPGSDWLQGLGEGLRAVAPLLFSVLFIRELTRKGGMAESHFRWPRDCTSQFRRAVTGFALGYLPAEMIVLTCLADTTSQHLHSLVRVVFMLGMLWVAYWVVFALHPERGIVARVTGDRKTGVIYKLRRFWRWLFVALPVAIVVMLWMGYMVAAMEFTTRSENTAMILLLSLLVYELLLRWFSIRERKLALAKLLAERRARREAKESEEEEQGEEDVAVQEEGKLDLVQVGAQTRQLLRSLVVFGALVALWFSWGEVNPIFRVLENRTLFWDVTAEDLVLAVLVVVATTLVARNLPGLLEIALLQNLPLDAGSRFAISTLARYLVVLIGFLSLFTVLDLEWSRFGWIAAALSVGLGFGLQEVVANFVCGLILLFERPVRVGDVITVGDVSGRVTRIRMRATTITDWDRREYVVPNKEFVTGRLLNWTLSNTINRITVQVGVAYGTDTERVRTILSEIAAEHPVVLDDPAPIITFSSFGDSSLNFDVRCYLPDIEQLLSVYHELHSEIHRRFKDEGIEIPFPQRDLHLRSGTFGSQGEK